MIKLMKKGENKDENKKNEKNSNILVRMKRINLGLNLTDFII